METVNRKIRSIEIPIAKIAKLKANWVEIYSKIILYGKIQIRFNYKTHSVDIRPTVNTIDPIYVDQCIEFIRAFIKGFKIEDALLILKYKDICLDSFTISEVKKMRINHVERAIGRIIGRNGKMKEVIENQLKVKFLLHDETILLLGNGENISIARDTISRLIMGSEPTSIMDRLAAISNKLKYKYGSIYTINDKLKPDVE